jgi:hypothetical protein
MDFDMDEKGNVAVNNMPVLSMAAGTNTRGRSYIKAKTPEGFGPSNERKILYPKKNLYLIVRVMVFFNSCINNSNLSSSARGDQRSLQIC